MLITKTFFAHTITRLPASALEFKNFYSILQKNSVVLDKNGESATTQHVPLCLGRPIACSNVRYALREVSRHFLNTMLATLTYGMLRLCFCCNIFFDWLCLLNYVAKNCFTAFEFIVAINNLRMPWV